MVAKISYFPSKELQILLHSSEMEDNRIKRTILESTIPFTVFEKSESPTTGRIL
jgi:hypothetical protein